MSGYGNLDIDEVNVLRMIDQGYQREAIMERLGITERRYYQLCGFARDKMGDASSTSEAIQRAKDDGQF